MCRYADNKGNGVIWMSISTDGGKFDLWQADDWQSCRAVYNVENNKKLIWPYFLSLIIKTEM